jgi:manganese oxidase
MNPPANAFDRLIVFVSVIGVLLMASIFVLVLQGPAVGSEDGAAGAGDEVSATVVDVELSEFAVSGDLTAQPGPVTLRVTNAGGVAHNLALDGGPSTPDLGAGESADLDLGVLEEGTYRIICTVPGHESAGMVATLAVGETSESSEGHESHGAGADPAEYAALDTAMMESILRFPAGTEGVGNQALEPEILPDGTKAYEMTVAITDWEVEPGKVVQAWTYNGQAPGPAIRVADGDRVAVTFHNDLPMGTDVHFHGIEIENQMDGVAPLTQPLIQPGESFTYEFVAEGPAVAMYHAHHHGQMQVPNGLFGTLIIGDTALPAGRTIGGIEVPADVEPAVEMPMVLNDAGVIGYSLNGKSFPATEPLMLEKGDWFVVHYYNEGLQVHPMHLHGFPQLVIAKDGFPLDEPYWLDTVNVAPGERYSVLVHADAAGAWVWHCHILTHVEREEGMFGMVTAVLVEE